MKAVIENGFSLTCIVIRIESVESPSSTVSCTTILPALLNSHSTIFPNMS